MFVTKGEVSVVTASCQDVVRDKSVECMNTVHQIVHFIGRATIAYLLCTFLCLMLYNEVIFMVSVSLYIAHSYRIWKSFETDFISVSFEQPTKSPVQKFQFPT